MQKREYQKHIVESVIIGIISSIVVITFFMPYFSLHSNLRTNFDETLMASNIQKQIIKETHIAENQKRVVMFEDIKDTHGTIFSPTLLLNNYNEITTPTIFFSSLDYYLNHNYLPGDKVEKLGVNGIYGGYYPIEHPYGENFLVVITQDLESLNLSGASSYWNINQDHKISIMPRGFRGANLFWFLAFTGSLYFVFGIISLAIEKTDDFLHDNLIRLLFVAITIMTTIFIYSIFTRGYGLNIILFSIIIAVLANIMMAFPLLVIWYGKIIYKKV